MVHTSSCGSLVAKLLDLNSRLPFSSFHRPLISMQKMWIDTPSRTDLAGNESSPRLEQNWHSIALPLTCGLFFSEHGSQRPSAVAEQQNLWNLTWQSEQYEKGLYCSWCGLRQPPHAVLSTPLGFFLVFLLFLRFMYSSNSRLSVIVRSWSASMLPYCSSMSRLAKQLRKSISVLASAILKFLRMRQAMYLSSTDSAGLMALAGSLMMRSQTFCNSELILTLFCFIRNSRKAISVAISDSCCLVPLFSLNTRCLSCRLAMKVCLLLIRQASSSDTSIILASSLPSKTARKCFSALSTSTRVLASDFNYRISSTYLYNSSNGTLPVGNTSLAVSITSLRLGTSSSRMPLSSSFSCSSMCRLQYVSISYRQNFSSRICFCTSFSKTPNCGERRRDEKMDSFFSKGKGSAGRLMGLGLLRIGCVRLTECLDQDYSPELFYSPSRFSKDIQNYYQPHQLPTQSFANSPPLVRHYL